MFSKPQRGGYKQRPSLFDFVNSKIIRKFVVSNCSSEVCMAKVGLENDTLKPPKCPSNWEYSTGQRQLLDIQSGEQMDRLSFSAQNRKAQISLSLFYFCTFRGKTAPHSPVARFCSTNRAKQKTKTQTKNSRLFETNLQPNGYSNKNRLHIL